MCIADDLPFIDGFFLAVSAVTSTGLTTVAMADISRQGFWILFFLIFAGGSLLLPVGPMLYRRYVYARIKKTYPANLVIANNPVINEFDLQDRALGLMLRIIYVYIFCWCIVGGLVLMGAMYMQPLEPELEERGFSRFSSAAFMSVSAFNNAGFTISSSSVEYHATNPVAYLVLCLLIVAGNTMAPIFYRLIIYTEMRYYQHFGWNVAAHRFILENPRRITVNTLPTREVIFLFITTTLLNAVQYIFLLASCLGRDSIITEGEADNRWDLAGMGFFQTISTRNAGLQIMKLRTMNQGMLLVYAIAMYLSGAPFVTALYASEDSQENVARDSSLEVDDDDYSDSEYDYEFLTDESESEGGTKSPSKSFKSGKNRRHTEEESDSDEESLNGLNRVESLNVMAAKTKTSTSTLGGEEEEASGSRKVEKKKSMRERTRTGSGNSADNEALNPGEGEDQQRISATQLVTYTVEEGKNTMTAESSDQTTALMPTAKVAASPCGKHNLPVHEIAPSLEELILQAGLAAVQDQNVKSEKADSPREAEATIPEPEQHDYHELVRRNSVGFIKTMVGPDPGKDSSAVLRRGSSAGSFNVPEKLNEDTSLAGMLNLRAGAKPKPTGSKWNLVRQSTLNTLKSALFLEPDLDTLQPKPLSPTYVRHKLMKGENLQHIPKDLLPGEHAELGKESTASGDGDDGMRRRRKSSKASSGSGSAKLLGALEAGFALPTLDRYSRVNNASQHEFIRQSSVEVLNQRKFEIQNRFVESFIMKHSFFIGVGVFICAFSEDDFMSAHPEVINLWYIIFEVVSAYGNVGLSLPEPGESYSLVGSFGFIGKLTICAIMMLGKHRALPKEKDAVIDFKCKRLRRAVNELGWQLKAADSPNQTSETDSRTPGENNKDSTSTHGGQMQPQPHFTGGINNPKIAPAPMLAPAKKGHLEIDTSRDEQLDFLSKETQQTSTTVSYTSPTFNQNVGLVQTT